MKMTMILRTLLDAAKANLSDAVRQEAVKVLDTLQQAYGDTDGGYVAVCDSPEEAKEHLKSRNAESLLPEWTNRWTMFMKRPFTCWGTIIHWC